METPSDETLWISLAELFFLDTEPSQKDFERVAELIKEKGWTSTQVESLLIRYIAPHAGANLGFLIYPVIGEWSGLDGEKLCAKIRRSMKIRTERPDWYFAISDWWCRRMLKTLGLEELLKRI